MGSKRHTPEQIINKLRQRLGVDTNRAAFLLLAQQGKLKLPR